MEDNQNNDRLGMIIASPLILWSALSHERRESLNEGSQCIRL